MLGLPLQSAGLRHTFSRLNGEAPGLAGLRVPGPLGQGFLSQGGPHCVSPGEASCIGVEGSACSSKGGPLVPGPSSRCPCPFSAAMSPTLPVGQWPGTLSTDKQTVGHPPDGCVQMFPLQRAGPRGQTASASEGL